MVHGSIRLKFQAHNHNLVPECGTVVLKGCLLQVYGVALRLLAWEYIMVP